MQMFQNITHFIPNPGLISWSLRKTNDAFLTPERIQKYEDMLNSADAITYATDEEYYYTADTSL